MKRTIEKTEDSNWSQEDPLRGKNLGIPAGIRGVKKILGSSHTFSGGVWKKKGQRKKQTPGFCLGYTPQD